MYTASTLTLRDFAIQVLIFHRHCDLMITNKTPASITLQQFRSIVRSTVRCMFVERS